MIPCSLPQVNSIATQHSLQSLCVPLGLPHVLFQSPLNLGYFALLLCLPPLMSVPPLSTQQALQVAKALDEELEDLKTLAKSLEEQNRSLMAQARHTVSAGRAHLATEKGQVKGQRSPEFQVPLTHTPPGWQELCLHPTPTLTAWLFSNTGPDCIPGTGRVLALAPELILFSLWGGPGEGAAAPGG